MVAIAACLLIAGCGGGVSEPEAAVEENQEVPVTSQNPSEGLRRMNGVCVMGHEVRTFLPCGSQKVYWIQADQPSLEQLQLAVDRFTDEPYEPFFAIVEGRLSSEVGDGFAADYDGQVIIERLIHLAPANELDCDG